MKAIPLGVGERSVPGASGEGVAVAEHAGVPIGRTIGRRLHMTDRLPVREQGCVPLSFGIGQACEELPVVEMVDPLLGLRATEVFGDACQSQMVVFGKGPQHELELSPADGHRLFEFQPPSRQPVVVVVPAAPDVHLKITESNDVPLRAVAGVADEKVDVRPAVGADENPIRIQAVGIQLRPLRRGAVQCRVWCGTRLRCLAGLRRGWPASARR